MPTRRTDTRRLRLTHSIAVALTLVLLPLHARADEFFWDGDLGDLWADSAQTNGVVTTNWDHDGDALLRLPMRDDSVHFGLGHTAPDRYSVIGITTQSAWLRVDNDALGLILHPGVMYELGSIQVGRSAGLIGDLLIRGGGTILGTRNFLGFEPGSTGILTVEGPGTVMFSTDGMRIGEAGHGVLNLLNGAAVNTKGVVLARENDSTGAVTVAGADTVWRLTDRLSIGQRGEGRLDILAGGTILGEDTAIATNPASSGQATIDGQGSRWTLGAGMVVGDKGVGTLRVQGGARIDSNTGIIGNADTAHGLATITGIGSTWHLAGANVVGSSGTGHLSIQNGASVNSAQAFIGLAPGSVGSVTVEGAGARLTAGSLLVVGNDGAGTLRLSAGATAHAMIAAIALAPGSNGDAVVNGETTAWNIGLDLTLGGTNTSPGGHGTLLIQDGGTVTVTGQTYLNDTGRLRLDGGVLNATNIVLSPNGSFEFAAGTLRVNTFEGDLANQAGTLGLGGSLNATQILGDYHQADAATLHIALAGNDPAAFGVLNVLGLSDLDGTLAVELRPGLNIEAGTAFDIVTAQTLQVEFNTHELPTGTTGQNLFAIEQVGSSLRLTALEDISVPIPEPSTGALLALVALAISPAKRPGPSGCKPMAPEGLEPSLR